MERRPIASRNTRWADSIAMWLARTGITPNAISVLGTACAAGAGACFCLTAVEALPDWPFWIGAGILVQGRLLANLFDGMVAQIQKSSSRLGELFNEIPDRFSDVFILIGFGLTTGETGWLGIVAALLAVLVAYVRSQMAVSGVPQQYCGPMAKQQRMAIVIVSSLVLLFLPGSSGVVFVQAALWIVIGGCIITIWRRLARGTAHLKGGSLPPVVD